MKISTKSIKKKINIIFPKKKYTYIYIYIKKYTKENKEVLFLKVKAFIFLAIKNFNKIIKFRKEKKKSFQKSNNKLLMKKILKNNQKKVFGKIYTEVKKRKRMK
jgi:hypothetical protein